MIEASSIGGIAGVRHGFFTRRGGYSDGLYASLNCGFGSDDDRSLVEANRGAVAGAMDVEADRLVTVHQWHSPDVITAKAPWEPAEAPEADALVTARPGLAIAILSADCTPVLFADRDGKAVGAAHAGWKGAIGGVLETAVNAMESLGCRRAAIAAVIGPTIQQENYEVGPEFRARFVSDDRDAAQFFVGSKHDGRFMFDLPGFVARRLQSLGLGSIENLGYCTYGLEDLFFSYRRATHRSEADYGRHISAISLTR